MQRPLSNANRLTNLKSRSGPRPIRPPLITWVHRKLNRSRHSACQNRRPICLSCRPTRPWCTGRVRSWLSVIEVSRAFSWAATRKPYGQKIDLAISRFINLEIALGRGPTNVQETNPMIVRETSLMIVPETSPPKSTTRSSSIEIRRFNLTTSKENESSSYLCRIRESLNCLARGKSLRKWRPTRTWKRWKTMLSK